MSNDRLQAAIADAFGTLTKRTELSLVEYTSISQHQHELEAVFARHFNNFTTVLPGAYSRHTMTAPLAGSVVDMLVLFGVNGSSKYRPSELIERFHRIVREHYSDCWPAKRSVSLVVRVGDFVFRVQPGFVTRDRHYLVPAQTWDGWVDHDSIGYKHEFARMNARHKGKLVDVVRMIKTWNRLTGNVFDGYYLELITVEAMRGYEIENYPRALRHVYRSMLRQVAFRLNDPACSAIDVEGLRDVVDLVDAMKLIQTAYRTADQAIEFAEQTHSPIAYSNWEKLFPGLWQHSTAHI